MRRRIFGWAAECFGPVGREPLGVLRVIAMRERMRDDFIVLVGGAPLNEEFGMAVGADAYCRDAGVAAETARRLIDERRARVPA